MPVGEQRLPRGRHGLPRELVLENQRARLVGAMVQTVAERGYDGTTVAKVVTRAKVSRQTFYESFSNREDCYRAAYEACFDFLRRQITAAPQGAAGNRSVGIRLGALLEGLAAHPDLTRFFLVSPAEATTAAAARHHEAVQELVTLLSAGHPEDASKGADTRAQAFAGGLSRLVTMKLNADRAGEIPSLLPELLELFRIMVR